MRNRILVLAIALASLLTTQCLLACSATQQAAYACCPHKGAPDRSVDASVPVTPVSVELDDFELIVSATVELREPQISRFAGPFNVSPPRDSSPGRITVLRL